jgi:hypothetical protein
MAVSQPREEVRPGDGPGISVGDVDLDLAEHDEDAGQPQRQFRARHHLLEDGEIHAGGLGGIVEGHPALEGVIGEEGARQHLQPAEHHPAGTRGQKRAPPGEAVGAVLARQEAQVIHLLADLRDDGEDDRRSRAEHDERESAVHRPAQARIAGPVAHRGHALHRDIKERQDLQHRPEGLRPRLEAVDEGDPVDDHRNDEERADEIAEA